MTTTHRVTCERRQFFGAIAGLAVGSAWSGLAWAGDRPVVTNPRATSGDAVVEPNWEQRLTISVGPAKAHLIGRDDKVIQAAVDYAARLGGGTVHVLPGTYRMRNAVYLQSGVRILGSGTESVLIKEPSQTSKLVDYSDWYDQEITLADAGGFQVGDGICLWARTPGSRFQQIAVCKRTLVARSGNRFKLDRALKEDFWLEGDPIGSTLFPLLSGDHIHDVVIENITLDGNRQNNEQRLAPPEKQFDSNHLACVFLENSSRVTLRGVTARNYNSDGMSWQICHDVVVDNCHIHDNMDLGLHPGSGSQRPVIRGNRLERNDIGLFFCYGVKGGLAEKNVIAENRSFGVSIGHRDTDNLIRDNEIVRSGKVGVVFRPESKAFAADYNRLENNRIIDSGPEDGIGVDVQGETESIIIAQNQLRETRKPMNRVGVKIGARTRDVKLMENQIEGFAVAVSDLRNHQ